MMCAMNNLRTLTYISLAIGVTAFHYSSLMLQPGLPCQSTSNQRYLLARPKSKWDLLTDEDDDDLDIDSTSSVVPTDMTYIESNIKRQLSNYDKLYEIGGTTSFTMFGLEPMARRNGDVSPEQAIEKQWPLIERHVWAMRLPVRQLSNLSHPFEVWYSPGNTEYDAARNDPTITFTKCSGILSYGGSDIPKELVGFLGKVYMGGKEDPILFVERNADGSVLKDRYCEGDWILPSDFIDRSRNNLNE